MELIEIAQLVTGIATLVVASVLIWQMIIQKKSLDIAHNDADSNMSLQDNFRKAMRSYVYSVSILSNVSENKEYNAIINKLPISPNSSAITAKIKSV